MSKRWVKWPRPGQLRGEGSWVDADEFGMTNGDWEHCLRTGFLPTHYGEEQPPDDAAPQTGE